MIGHDKPIPLSMVEVRKQCDANDDGSYLVSDGKGKVEGQGYWSSWGSYAVGLATGTQTLISQIRAYSKRHYELSALIANGKAIGERTVALPDDEYGYTAGTIREISEDLAHTAAGSLIEAENALISHFLLKNSYDDEQEVVDALMKQLKQALKDANLSKTNHDSYLRQLRSMISEAYRKDDHSYAAADLHQVTQTLVDMCKMDKVMIWHREVCDAEAALIKFIQQKDNDDEDTEKVQELTDKLSDALDKALNSDIPLLPEEHDQFLKQVRAVTCDASMVNLHALTDYCAISQSLADMTMEEGTNVMHRPLSISDDEMSSSGSETIKEPASKQPRLDTSDSDDEEGEVFEATEFNSFGGASLFPEPEEEFTSLSTRNIPLDPSKSLPVFRHQPRPLEPEATITADVASTLGLNPEMTLTLTGRPAQSLMQVHDEIKVDTSIEDDWNEPLTTRPELRATTQAEVDEIRTELGVDDPGEIDRMRTLAAEAIEDENRRMQDVLQALDTQRQLSTDSDEDDELDDLLIEDGILDLDEFEEVEANLRQRLQTMSRDETPPDVASPSPPSPTSTEAPVQPSPELKLAHPLTRDERAQLNPLWVGKFQDLYGLPISDLPAYERKQLDIAYYNACHKDGQPAGLQQLEEALKGHKNMTESLLPGTCQTLREQGNYQPFFPTSDLWNQCKPQFDQLRLSVSNKERFEHIFGFFKRTVPLLCESPYDGQGNLQQQLIMLQSLQQYLPQMRAEIVEPFVSDVATQRDDPALGMSVAIPQDLDLLERRIAAKIKALQTMIQNDFRQHANLKKGMIKLHRGALEAVNKALDEAEHERDSHHGKFKKLNPKYHAAKRRCLTLQVLKKELEDDLAQHADTKAQSMLVPDIIHRLHKTRKDLSVVLEKAGINKKAFKDGLEKEINLQKWDVVQKTYVMEHEGKYHYFKVQNSPVSATRVERDPATGEFRINFDGGEGADAFGLDNGGRSSMSPQTQDHAVNLWAVNVTNEETGEVVLQKVRSGVPVSFPMFARKATDQAITNVVVERLREIIGLSLLSSPTKREQLLRAIDNPNERVDFTEIHTSLLSPDRVRRLLNAVSGQLGEGAQKKIASVLDDEQEMHRFIISAMKELNESNTLINFRDTAGEEHVVAVKYDGILFSCPINSMGQKWAYNVWKQADDQNKASAIRMFGGTNPNEPMGGKVQEFLDRPDVSDEQKNLVKKAAQMVQLILHNKMHHEDNEVGVLLGGLLSILGQHVVDSYHDFCKSGKDRTGYENQFCIHLATMLSVMGNKDIPPIDLPDSIAKRLSAQTALATTGQVEVVLQCLAEMGLKIDQGPARTGNVYHQVHFDDKKNTPKVGTVEV